MKTCIVLLLLSFLCMCGCTFYHINVTVNPLGVEGGGASKVVVDIHDNNDSDTPNTELSGLPTG